MNGIVILNYNDFETTKIMIHKIEEYKSLDVILIVDNCSTDSSFEELKKMSSDKVIVIRTMKNSGYASGNNYGLEFLNEHFEIKNVIISNPDIEVDEHTIIDLFDFLDINENVACVSCKVMNNKGELFDNFAWKSPTYGTLLTSTFLILYKLFSKILGYSFYYNRNEFNELDYFNVDVITGCFFASKMECLKSVGFFDDSTFLFGEENILFFKLKKTGYINTILMNDSIVHHHGVSINKSISSEIKKQNILLKSNLIYLKKYLKIGFLKELLYKAMFSIGKYEKLFINMLRDRK